MRRKIKITQKIRILNECKSVSTTRILEAIRVGKKCV